MTLSILQKKLDNLGFETKLTNNILLASAEYGENFAVEITVDSGGGAKVVKKTRENLENDSLVFKKKKIPIVCENISTETFRVQIDSLKDFEELEKEIMKA